MKSFIILLFISLLSVDSISEDKPKYELIRVPVTSDFSNSSESGWVLRPEYCKKWGVEISADTVTLDEFYIGKHEISFTLWEEVKIWGEDNGYIFKNSGRCGSDESVSNDQHPVTMISWNDCIAWCNAYSEYEGFAPVYYADSTHTTIYRNSVTDMEIVNECVDWQANGFRLPTEAEWEYAARYIDGSDFVPYRRHSGYNLHPEIDSCAWFSGNSLDRTHQMGQLKANSLGLNDMSGNVWEWCWDWSDSRYTGTLKENLNSYSSNGIPRIVCGGSYHRSRNLCATGSRHVYYSKLGFCAIGFRVCRSIGEK